MQATLKKLKQGLWTTNSIVQDYTTTASPTIQL